MRRVVRSDGPAGDAAPSVDFDDLWRPRHWGDTPAGTTLMWFFAAVVVAAIAWNLVANLWLPSAAWVVANLTFAALLFAGARRAGCSVEELGARRDRVARGLVVGAVAAGIACAVVALALAVPASRSWFEDEDVAAHAGWTDAYYVAVRIPLGTVVLEEVLFRGVLLALALRRWSVRTAVLVTAALFGAWHVVPAAERADGAFWSVFGATVATVAATAAAGVMFAWLRLRANGLVAPALAHVATNSFAYVAALVALELR